jgi:type IV pilus biogenesis protein CpaD/CtpE
MRKLLLLTAGLIASTACHNRTEDQTGAAPAQGRTDTTAVTHVIDSTRTGPPGVAGRPGNATITPDSVGIDSTAVRDSTASNNGTSPVSTPQDTLGPRDITPAAGDSAAMQGDSTMHHATDSTMHHATPDTTGAK